MGVFYRPGRSLNDSCDGVCPALEVCHPAQTGTITCTTRCVYSNGTIVYGYIADEAKTNARPCSRFPALPSAVSPTFLCLACAASLCCCFCCQCYSYDGPLYLFSCSPFGLRHRSYECWRARPTSSSTSRSSSTLGSGASRTTPRGELLTSSTCLGGNSRHASSILCVMRFSKAMREAWRTFLSIM